MEVSLSTVLSRPLLFFFSLAFFLAPFRAAAPATPGFLLGFGGVWREGEKGFGLARWVDEARVGIEIGWVLCSVDRVHGAGVLLYSR